MIKWVMSFLHLSQRILLVFVGLILLWPVSASSQIKLTSHAELNDKSRIVYLGPHSYETIDSNDTLNADNIHARYNSADRGTLIGRKIFNFGLDSKPRWISFSVTNNSTHENWLLDFGSLLQGRLGQIDVLEVRNYTRDELYYEGSHISPDHAGMDKSVLAVRITPGQTELFTIYLKSASNLPATYMLSIIRSDSWFSLAQLDKWGTGILFVSLALFCGFFATLYILNRNSWYGLSGLYVLINLCLITALDSSVVSSFYFSDKMPAFLMSASIIVCALLFYVFYNVKRDDHILTSTFSIMIALVLMTLGLLCMPIHLLAQIGLDDMAFLLPSVHFISVLICNITFLILAIKIRTIAWDVAYPFITSWAMLSVGLLGSTVGLFLFKGNDAFALNLYALSMVPSGLFLAIAALKDYRLHDEDRLSAVTRKSRADQALSKLQQSKEAEDQARLMRVIERERELMSELREKEALQTEEMRRAKDEADQANAAKSAFLAVVSHEIRTPMNGIMGMLKLLQDTSMNEEQVNYLLTMQKTGETMVALLNDILDFEKIETGAMELEHINMDLHAMVQGIVTLMSGYVVDKDIVLKSDISPEVPRYALGDPTRLRQVLLNLASNAIKFTDSGSVTIQLSGHKVEDLPNGIQGDYEVTFGVVDTGVGISEEAQETLFEPFRQADSSIARQYGGSGLGLTISMRLVEIMGSSIHLESKLGEGSHFFFSLLMEEGYGEDADILPGSAYQDEPRAKPLWILVVEDNEVNRRVLQSTLEKSGHTVLPAASAEVGLDILEDRKVDVVFMDINMPGMSGLEMAEHIRAKTKFSELMLVAITGNLMEEDIADIKAAGINDVIGKPIDFDHVQRILIDVSNQQIPSSENTQPISNTAEGPSVEVDLYDSAALDSLYDTLGAETCSGLVEDCLAKVDEIVELIEAPDHRDDVDFIYERMHELKGMAYNFGLTRIGDLARDSELAAKGKDLEGALKAAAPLVAAKDETRAAIEAWIASKASA